MTNNLGRNDLCSCGSGKKYKKCCIPTVSTDGKIFDFEWMKLRQLEGAVIDDHLQPYLAKDFTDEIISYALGDLLSEYKYEDLPEEMDFELFFQHFFLPWLLFNWIPCDEFDNPHFDGDITIAQNYLNQHGDRLNSAEKRFIEAMDDTFYSFYSILEVEKEKFLVVKDLLLGTIHTLKERAGTHFLQCGDMVFGRILTMDNQSIFIGMAPFRIPIPFQHEIFGLKEYLIDKYGHITPALLHDMSDVDLPEYYFSMVIDAFNAPKPILANTDGDLLEPTKSFFTISIPPEVALKALMPLTLSKDMNKFLKEGSEEIKFPWLKKGNKKHKHSSNTLMGNVTIKGDTLTLETNSEKRDKQGQKLLNKYLRDAVCFQYSEIESIDEMLKSQPGSGPSEEEKKRLLTSPELQKHITAMNEAHWKNWLDTNIPALGGMTPRESAKTQQGRERLEALLLQYERREAGSPDNLLKVNVEYLREELGLDQ